MDSKPLNDAVIWAFKDLGSNWKSYRDDLVRQTGVEEPSLSDEDIAHTNANLALAVELIQELLDLPEDVDPQLYKVSVVVLPPPERHQLELVEANLRIARKLDAEGKKVVIWTIGSGKGTSLQEYEALLKSESNQLYGLRVNTVTSRRTPSPQPLSRRAGRGDFRRTRVATFNDSLHPESVL